MHWTDSVFVWTLSWFIYTTVIPKVSGLDIRLSFIPVLFAIGRCRWRTARWRHGSVFPALRCPSLTTFQRRRSSTTTWKTNLNATTTWGAAWLTAGWVIETSWQLSTSASPTCAPGAFTHCSVRSSPPRLVRLSVNQSSINYCWKYGTC